MRPGIRLGTRMSTNGDVYYLEVDGFRSGNFTRMRENKYQMLDYILVQVGRKPENSSSVEDIRMVCFLDSLLYLGMEV